MKEKINQPFEPVPQLINEFEFLDNGIGEFSEIKNQYDKERYPVLVQERKTNIMELSLIIKQLARQTHASILLLKESIRFQLQNDMVVRHYFKLLLHKHEHYVFAEILKMAAGYMPHSQTLSGSLKRDDSYFIYEDKPQLERIKNYIRKFDDIKNICEIDADKKYPLLSHPGHVIAETKSDQTKYLILLQAYYIGYFLNGIYCSLDTVSFQNKAHKEFLEFMWQARDKNLVKQTAYERHKKFPFISMLPKLKMHDSAIDASPFSSEKYVVTTGTNVLCPDNDRLERKRAEWEDAKGTDTDNLYFLVYESEVTRANDNLAKANHLLILAKEYQGKPLLIRTQLTILQKHLTVAIAIFELAIHYQADAALNENLSRAYAQRAGVHQRLAAKFPRYSNEHWKYLEHARADYVQVHQSDMSPDNFIAIYREGKSLHEPCRSPDLYDKAIALNPYFWEAHYQRLLAYYELNNMMHFHRLSPCFSSLNTERKPVLNFLKCISNSPGNTELFNKVIKVSIRNNARHPLYLKIHVVDDRYLLSCSGEFSLQLLLQFGSVRIKVINKDKILLHHYDDNGFKKIINDLDEKQMHQLDSLNQYIDYFEDYYLVNHSAPLEKQITFLMTLPASRQLLINHYTHTKKYFEANYQISKALADYQKLLLLFSRNSKNEMDDIKRQIVTLKIKRAAIYQQSGYFNCEEQELLDLLKINSTKNKFYPAVHYRLAILGKKKGDMKQFHEHLSLVKIKKRLVRKAAIQLNSQLSPPDAQLFNDGGKKYKEATALLMKNKPDMLIDLAVEKLMNEFIKTAFHESSNESLARFGLLFNAILATRTIKAFYESIIYLQDYKNMDFWWRLMDLELVIDLKDIFNQFKEQFSSSITKFQDKQKLLIDDLLTEQTRLQKKDEQFNAVSSLKNCLLESLSNKKHVDPECPDYKKLTDVVQKRISSLEKVKKISVILDIKLADSLQINSELAEWVVALVIKALEPPEINSSIDGIKIEGYNLFLSQLVETMESKLQNAHFVNVVIIGANVFLDRSLMSTRWCGKNLIVTAQYIECTDKVSIVVSGKPGTPGCSVENQPDTWRIGENGKHGRHGVNGGAGQNGGDIILIASKAIRNPKALIELNVSGGLGGSGGNGGNGGNGMKGVDGVNGETEEPGIGSISDGYYRFSKGRRGTSGGFGGNGGNGGLGGFGGSSGQVLIKEKNLDITHKLTSCIKNEDYSEIAATDSKPGEGGRGALGGLDGYDELRIKRGFFYEMRVEKKRNIVITKWEEGVIAPRVPSEWTADEASEQHLREQRKGKDGEKGLGSEALFKTGMRRSKAAVKQHSNVKQQQSSLVAGAQMQQSFEMEKAQNLHALDSVTAQMQAQQHTMGIIDGIIGITTTCKTNAAIILTSQQHMVKERSQPERSICFATEIQPSPELLPEEKIRFKDLNKALFFNQNTRQIHLDKLDDPLLVDLCANLFK